MKPRGVDEGKRREHGERETAQASIELLGTWWFPKFGVVLIIRESFYSGSIFWVPYFRKPPYGSTHHGPCTS